MKQRRMIVGFVLIASLLFLMTEAIFATRPEASFIDPPHQFDLRNVGGVNYVTSVKNQQGGTCWTHGTMAAIEGNLLMTGNWAAAGETGEPNLAEYHLDWWNGFNTFNDDDDPGGGGIIVHQGGDYRVASAYLTRGEGAVRDIDGQSYSTAPHRSDTSYHYYYPRDIEWYVAGSDLSNINTIKNKIMTEGVVGTCMCYNDAFMDYYYYTHYQPPDNPLDPNHAIAIVGWDDYKSTQAPEGPGAWICKNSWGSGWGLNGYFWISYYDKHCCKHPEMGAVSFQNVEPLAYDRIYYHDYHGWRDTKTDVSAAFNAFTAQGNELLRAVSFFTAADNVTYTVKIYDRFVGGALLDELSTKSGFIAYTGFHTIDLDTPVTLSTGNDFYIYLELSAGGQPYDRTSEVPVLLGAKYQAIVASASQPGQSYYWSGSTWQDLYYFDNPPWTGTANFCMKGLATIRGMRVSPGGDFESQGPVGGPFSPSSTNYQLVNRNPQPINYEVTSDPVATWITLSGDISGVLAPSETTQVTVEINDSAQTLSEGTHLAAVYFTNTTDHFGDTSREVLLMVGEPVVKYEWMLDSDPGWTTEGEWAFGQPTGGGGEHGGPDPTSGHTGNNVYGYNLNGDYTNNLPETHLTSLPVDCSELFDVHLKFWRWLGVEQPTYDHAYVRVSSDGTDWTTVWENATEIADISWVEMNLDISDVADDQPTVYLRWTMGQTTWGYNYCGWNIDDIQISAYEYVSVCGDVNRDGKINTVDVVYLINYLFINGPAPECEPVSACGDLNRNGKIDVTDVVYLINYLFIDGPPPGSF
jgi:C1A family cysteine protease